jgi:hypothetical protein
MGCENNKEVIKKSVPIYYIFQHVDQVMLDSSIEEFVYKISNKEVTKQEVLEVEKIIKKRGWAKPYFNCDSTKIFIPNYTSDDEGLIMQLYLLDSEIKQ